MDEVKTVPVYIKKEELKNTPLTDYKIDYTDYKNGGEMLTVLEDDATRWATAFSQFYKKKYDVDINVEFTFLWFANAIETTYVFRKDRDKIINENLEKEIQEEADKQK